MRYAVLFCVLASATAWALPTPSRPGKEVRSLTTTSYEISILKSGRVDVVTTTGEPIITDAFPMIQLENDERPRPMSVNGLSSTRTDVRDNLGQGNGVLLKKSECEWYLNSYETQPFFTVRAVYVNTSKKPVKVKALLPWCVGAPGKGAATLGPGTAKAVFLENERGMFSDKRIPTLETGNVLSLGNTAGYNPQTKRSLIAGFLTAVSSFPQITVERASKDPDAIGALRAFCEYDPPMEVQPGGRLESDQLYVAVSESSPFVGLERYGDAVAHMGSARDTRRLVPHGWDSWSTAYRTDISESKMMSALEFVDKNLKRYGWTHFAVDDGWNVSRGDWEAVPSKFPQGMKWLAGQIHARGMTAGLWVAPFRVDASSQFAKDHPDWLVGPSAAGKEIVGGDGLILDITAPGAYNHVKSLIRKIAQDWGYDVIKADYTYYLLLMDHWRDATMTRSEVLRVGMRAIREGLGEDKYLLSFPPGVIGGPYLDALRVGDDTAPIWRKSEGKWAWGCVDALTNAARRYYFAPYQWAPDQDCAFFGHESVRKRWEVADRPPLTMAQSIAWYTGAALTGGVVEVGDSFEELTAPEIDVLRKLLPAPARPARPIDLFDGGSPRIWSLPIHSPIGDWRIVGVFNWDTSGSQEIELDFAQLDLNPVGAYTVFDYWGNKYYGTAQGKLKVNVAPGSVRLLGLKPFEGHPMFLSTSRHFTQGATDFTALGWDDASRRLNATFTAVADTDYELKVLVPESFTLKKVLVSGYTPTTTIDGKTLTIAFHTTSAGPITWSAEF